MWRNVEIRELRLFLILCEELHFGRTAERAGVTQSRASQSISALERKLGVQLVRRTSRRVSLTAGGERFRDEAGAALRALEDVLKATEESREDVAAPVRVGVLSAATARGRLQTAVTAFRAAHPEGRVEFVALPFRDHLTPLRTGDVDAVVSFLPVEQPDLQAGQVLARERLVLAVGRDHPLAQREDVGVEDWATYASGRVDVAGHPSLEEAMNPTRTPSGRHIRQLTLDSPEPSALILAVVAGDIVQPVTAWFAATYAHPELRYIPIRDLPSTRWALVWRRGDTSVSLRAFLTCIAGDSQSQPGAAQLPTH